jgi:uncharacterized membrane protein YeiB
MGIYNAELSAGSLMPLESRRIAALLLTHPTAEQWDSALKNDNLLQKKTMATARRQSRLIRNRLQTLDDQGLELIANGGQEVCLQMLFVAALKHSQLLADFLRTVYAERLRGMETHLAAKDWESFLIECNHRDEAVLAWSDSTKAKLFQVLVRVLAEAKYLESTRGMKLTPQSVHPDVVRYLKTRNETKLLALMEQQ